MSPAPLLLLLSLALPFAGGAHALQVTDASRLELPGALTVGFEDAELRDGAILAAGLSLSPLRRGGFADGAGGALRLVTPRRSPAGAADVVVSTRDLAWPYGLELRFDSASAVVSLSRFGANRDWEATAYDVSGEEIGRAVLDESTPETFALDAGAASMARLVLRSLGGYDWVYLDDLRVVPALTSSDFQLEARSAATVPAPGAVWLTLLAVAALIGRRFAGLLPR